MCGFWDGIFLRNFLICFNRRTSDALALMGGFPGTPPVYRVTNNRRLADACLIDMIAGMGCFDWIVGVALSMHSASSRRPGPDGLAFRRHLAVSPVTRNRRPSDALGFLGGSPGTPTVYRATNNRRLTDAWLLAGDSNYYIYGLNGYDE